MEAFILLECLPALTVESGKSKGKLVVCISILSARLIRHVKHEIQGRRKRGCSECGEKYGGWYPLVHTKKGLLPAENTLEAWRIQYRFRALGLVECYVDRDVL